MSLVAGTRPVQLKISVNDVDEAIAFYRKVSDHGQNEVVDRTATPCW